MKVEDKRHVFSMSPIHLQLFLQVSDYWVMVIISFYPGDWRFCWTSEKSIVFLQTSFYLFIKIFWCGPYLKSICYGITFVLYFVFLGAWGMWNLHYPTRNGNLHPLLWRWSLIYWSPGKFPNIAFLKYTMVYTNGSKRSNLSIIYIIWIR